MGFIDQNGDTEFPNKKDDVFEAICRAVPIISGMRLHNADKASGHIAVKAGISIWSFGEDIVIQLSSVAPDKTKVHVNSGSNIGAIGGILDMGKNRRNVERIIAGTAAILSQAPAGRASDTSTETHSPSSSIADELKKLKTLLDEGILTQDEFNKQKQKLLG
jgi:uncharacterized protein (DUF1499 family)